MQAENHRHLYGEECDKVPKDADQLSHPEPKEPFLG
jgi:hypothetical protein